MFVDRGCYLTTSKDAVIISGITSYESTLHTWCSCEIEDFVETHLCVISDRRSRVLRGVHVLMEDIGRRLPLVLASQYQGEQGDTKTFSL